MNTKIKAIIILIIIIHHPCISQQRVISQNYQVQALHVKPVKSIGDTIFLGIYDFDFLPDGTLIVCDKLDYRIKRLNRTGQLIQEIGKRGKDKNEFLGPLFVAVGITMLAVADYSSPRVQLFTHGLEFVREFRCPGFVMGLQFDIYENLWIGTHANLSNLTKLIQYDRNGKVLSNVRLRHASENMFDNLYYFVISQTDTITVAYNYQNIIEQYSNSQYLEYYSFPAFPRKTKYLTSIEVESNIKFPEGEFVEDLYLDSNNYLYLLGGDYSFNPRKDVFIFNLKRELVAMLQLPNNSYGIAIDAQGYLWSIELNRTVLTQYEIFKKPERGTKR